MGKKLKYKQPAEAPEAPDAPAWAKGLTPPEIKIVKKAKRRLTEGLGWSEEYAWKEILRATMERRQTIPNVCKDVLNERNPLAPLEKDYVTHRKTHAAQEDQAGSSTGSGHIQEPSAVKR